MEYAYIIWSIWKTRQRKWIYNKRMINKKYDKNKFKNVNFFLLRNVRVSLKNKRNSNYVPPYKNNEFRSRYTFRKYEIYVNLNKYVWFFFTFWKYFERFL